MRTLVITLASPLLALLALALPVSALATGKLAVSPTSGPVGTVFTVTGVGFIGNATVDITVTKSVPNAAGGRGDVAVLKKQVIAGPDGSFRLPIDSAQFTADECLVSALQEGGQGSPLALAAKFTVTSRGLPGVPNTGAGGTQVRTLRPFGLFVAGALLAALGSVALGHVRFQRRGR